MLQNKKHFLKCHVACSSTRIVIYIQQLCCKTKIKHFLKCHNAYQPSYIGRQTLMANVIMMELNLVYKKLSTQTLISLTGSSSLVEYIYIVETSIHYWCTGVYIILYQIPL